MTHAWTAVSSPVLSPLEQEDREDSIDWLEDHHAEDTVRRSAGGYGHHLRYVGPARPLDERPGAQQPRWTG